LGIVATPGEPDEPATLELHPETAAFTIENQTTTVAAGQDSSISIDPAQTDTEGDAIGTTLVVSGQIAADADPQFNVYDVPDPARYARTLFIEALTRAGATVAADPTGTNSTEGLPAFGSYPQSDGLGAIVSPPTGETATLIWKISHNYGANLAVCLLAVTAGSTECTDGLAAVHDRLGDLDLTNNEVWILNGAGEEFSSTTPRAVVTWLTWLRGLEWGDQLSAMLPILGEDGSLSLFQTDAKFVSGTGWPSFFQPINRKDIWLKTDTSYNMVRLEILCSRCDSHLGHLFPDGPEDKTGLRYCINGESLKFKQKKS
ncbi:MAG: peptide-methionine (R)-S-oxide reductase, partial [Armatimonadetes bacterium]|nr:peptide-methionine (R)-S-oxide reductase [Armatimonadota bacterium]